MKKMEILSSLTVLAAGVAWYYTELFWVGFMVIWIYLALYAHHGIDPVVFYTGGLVGTVLAQLAPSLLVAWFISHVQPRHWLWYSLLAVLPVIVLSLVHYFSNAESYRGFMWVLYCIETVILLVQVPLLLRWFYRIADRRNTGKHTAAIRGDS